MLSSTILALALAAPDAAAADIKIKNIRVRQTGDSNYRTVVVVNDANDQVADVTASLAVDGVGETVPLDAEGGWVHGTATVSALPPSGSTATLTAYDAYSAPIATFTSEVGSRTWRGVVCGDGTSCPGTHGDLSVAGTSTFATDAGYELGFDLAGADAAGVVYVTITFDVSTTDCTSRLGCTTYTKTTTYDVALDAVGKVYSGPDSFLVESATDLTVEASDADGTRLDWATAEIVPAWDDGGSGTTALATDEDPLTSVALHGGAKELADILENQYMTVLTSDGWELGDTLPTYAEITVDGGEVWEVPANSYQVAAATPITFKGDPSAEAFTVAVDGKTFTAGSPVGGRGLCQYGTCVALGQEDDGTWTLSATAYAATVEALPTSVKVALAGTTGSATPTATSYTLAYDAEVAVVFANAVDIVGDPSALDLSGKIRLRGRSTLFVGHFAGQFATDEDGDLVLATKPHGEPVSSRGDILIGGEPIGIELTSDTDGDGLIGGPPAVVMKNGRGTRQTAVNTNQTQQSELL